MKRMHEQNLNTADYWNARHREADHIWDPMNIIDLCAAQIRPGESILDVGVGSAVILTGISKLVKNLTYQACDFSSEAIEKLRRRIDLPFEFSRLFVWDAREPYPGEAPAADVVLANELLEHMEHPKAVLRNLAGLARRALLISTPNGTTIPGPEHLWAFTEQDITHLLEPYGKPTVKRARRARNIIGYVEVAK